MTEIKVIAIAAVLIALCIGLVGCGFIVGYNLGFDDGKEICIPIIPKAMDCQYNEVCAWLQEKKADLASSNGSMQYCEYVPDSDPSCRWIPYPTDGA